MSDLQKNEGAPKKPSKLKNHLKKYKTGYLVAGTATVTAAMGVGAGFLIGSKTVVVNPEVFAQAKNIALLQWKPVSKVTVKVIRRGHPGMVIKVNETGEIFASIRRMCEVLGIDRFDYYKYANGTLDNVKGLTFTVLGEAS